MSLQQAKELPIKLRVPKSEDGPLVNALVEECPPLDPNSAYCNLLQCSHFAETSVAADLKGELVGFISGYIVPGRRDTLFVWQVAVGSKARGQGLATKMLKDLLSRPETKQVTHIETTITEDNEASWNLFRGLAKRLGASVKSRVMFDAEEHFDGEHDSEMLVRIGPVRREDETRTTPNNLFALGKKQENRS